MYPRVTVLASIYKSSEFLFNFLLDIKKQNILSQMEILFLDANPDDSDLEIIKPFLYYSNFKHIKVENSTVYEAWNRGVKLANSDIITNWNCDDRRAYGSLEKQVKFLEDNKDIDVCYGNLKISNKANESFSDCKSNRYWPVLEGTLENQLKHNSPHCLPVWRKSIHERFGMFNTKYFSAADYDMWFRVLEGGGKLGKMDEVVGLYYENPTSISRNKKTLSRAISEVNEVRSKYLNL